MASLGTCQPSTPGPPVNPFAARRDERSGPQLEGAMIVQSLMTAFAFAFLATAALGHLLLLQAAFAPGNNPKSGKGAKRPSGRAPITGAGIAP